ncbi:MAG: potassium channel family protein [Bacteroidia bacterium]
MFLYDTISSFLRDKEYREILAIAFIIISLGTVAYHFLEGWSWVDSFYFSVVTLTTVGFGDFAPQTDAGKLFTVFYIIMGIGMILGFINALYDHYRDLSKANNGNNNNP